MHSSTAMILIIENFIHLTIRIICRIVPFLLLFNLACGQTNPKAIRLFQDGQELLAKKKSDQAVKSFESAISLDPAYRQAYLELYQFYFNQGDMAKALEVLQRATRGVTQGKASLLFTLAQLELNNGLYETASTHFTEYLSLNTKDTLTRAKAQLLLDKTRFSLANLKDSIAFAFIPLNPSINTSYPEYLPSLDAAAETLVFTRRTNNQEDLYISRKLFGLWSDPVSWPKNTSKNEGAHVISADGKTIVFTGCAWEDSFGGCDLYISEFSKSKWSNPRNIGSNINSKHWESQPSLSANGRIIYFVSDRPGGLGGHDIWKSEKLSTGWSRPVNAGPGINTSGDEFSPSLHADGVTLYFRSDGKPGFGSQDLFLAQKVFGGIWAEAVNLGYPLNDHRDQGAMVVALDGFTAYYTRQSINQFNQLISSDIVTFVLPARARANACRYIKGTVIDSQSSQPLPNIRITIAGGNDLARKDTLYSNPEGNYLLVVPAYDAYQVHVQASGFNLYSDRIVSGLSVRGSDTLHHPILLERLAVEDSLVSKPITLHNVLFELNSYTLLEESYNELNALIALLKDHPEFNISIHGHTDNTGGSQTNLILSRQRAMAIYNYLVSREIDTRRLTYEGFGDSKPIADNQTEAGRRLNRRVEFVLSKKLNKK